MKHSKYIHQIRTAREHFLGNGEVPDGLLPESIHRSWERCIKTGLPIDRIPEFEPASATALNELREMNVQLLAQSQAEMENLHTHITGTQSMVILGDSEGTILHAIGDPDFMSKAERVALQPGVSWREDVTGTNAIGTALVEKTPVFVMGAEHYVERNAFLNCSASPIIDPYGGVIGVLDISGDHRQPQEHTMALVRMSAQMIENRLFNGNFLSDVTIRFHSRAEFIGTLWEGIAVFSADGKLKATNRSGAFQLGIKQNAYLNMQFESLFEITLESFLDSIKKKTPYLSQRLTLHNGVQLYAKADAGSLIHAEKTSVHVPSGSPVKQPLPLDLLKHGDIHVTKVIEKAKLAIGHDLPILIEGETGTGKEMLAKAIHQSGSRKHGTFVAINCAAIPEGLIESELFGHEEGAFTGSRRRGAIGRVQQAHGGTLFLDEVGEMPLALQARLLRVIQEREVSPLGSSKAISVDIAIISATNCRLKEKVIRGEFREDLYYRLNGLRLKLPALRERSDLKAIIHVILKDKLNKPDVIIDDEALAVMQAHPWRGNVRQLEHVLRSAMIFMEGNVIRLEHLPEDFLEDAESEIYSADFRSDTKSAKITNIADAEALLIKNALAQHRGNVTAVASELGVSRATVYRKAKRLGIK